MLYKTLEIKDLIDTKNKDRVVLDLMENSGSHFKIAYLKKHEEVDSNMSPTDVCIFVLEGEIELIFSDVDNCMYSACGCSPTKDDEEETKKYRIKKDNFFLFEKNTMYSIKALKDSTFFVIKI